MTPDPESHAGVPGVPQLRTARFTLRPMRRQDAAALLPTFGDERQCLYLSRSAFASEEELWSWLSEPEWPGRTWIAEDAQGAVVGRFVAVPGDPGVHEIGYVTCHDRQGEGVARECIQALIAFLFEDKRTRTLTAEVDIENVPSVRLLERLGFRRDALHLAHEETHKGWCDMAFYSLDRAGYARDSGEKTA